MIVRDILSLKGQRILSIGPNATLSEAVSLMVEHNAGSLAVLENGKMAGMLTFREILIALNQRDGALGHARVADAMIREPVVGSPDDPIDHIRNVMTQNEVRYLPVMEGEELIGVISFHDVAKAALSEANFEARLLRRYIEHSQD